MAKNAPVKKSKRRLKRSVRRSVAAVLMITAIGVAAVPVPENAAAPEISLYAAAADVHQVYSYDVLRTGKEGDKDIPELKGLFEDEPNSKEMLELYDDETNSGKDVAVKTSYKVVDNGTKEELTWEYRFYEKSDNVVLCKYNSPYIQGTTVTLDYAPILEYFKVPTAVFDEYFEHEFSNAEGNRPSTDSKFSYKSGKLNIKLSDNLNLVMNADPANDTVTYSYDDFINDDLTLDERDLFFLTKFGSNWFENRKALYGQYKSKHDEWEENRNKYLQDNPEGSYNVEEPKKNWTAEDETTTMSKALALDPTKRVDFFCYYCQTLNNYGTGYTLKSVLDKTEASTGEVNAYIAYNDKDNKGDTILSPDCENIGGYMVISKGKSVTAIGKRAFTGVGNVSNIVLPTTVHFIGDEAFYHCNSMTSIDILNVTVIGNRAFQECQKLASVTMRDTVETIGVESFKDCANLTSVAFSSNTRKIGAGAFANCIGLTQLDLDRIEENYAIGAAAFYNCTGLTQVKMKDTGAGLWYVGDSAFAVVDGDNMTEFTFPSTINDNRDSAGNIGYIGDRIFSGRSSLTKVVFPSNYGRNRVIKLPANMFHGCSKLSYVEFYTNKGSDSTACSNLGYDADMFADVNNKDFYVSGPKERTTGDVAAPRESTWNAVTRVYDEPGFVPYLYYENGVEYYEICSDDYLLCIRKNPDGTGTLTSCTRKDPDAPLREGTLLIPDKVGDTAVVAIDTGCFSDTGLTSSVKKLVINDNIKEIAPSTFENINGKWDKLQEAIIGSSVETMGANAFSGCVSLTDITFNTPVNNDYTKLDFPSSALHTNGDKLTIHGDIVKGYRPFEYAMDSSTYVKDPQTGIRVCYQSRWDSPSSKHLTVMYGVADKTDEKTGVGKDGYVTLLDYPKYSELEDMDSPAGAELKAHCLEREQQFYEKYATVVYDSRRSAFANAWNTASSPEEVYKDPQLYGPWINEEFCTDNNWERWKDQASVSKPETNSVLDWLLEPLVAEAAPGNPKPYFETYHFNFMDNYKDCLGNESEIPRFEDTNELIDYLGWNEFEKQMISSVEDIVIPAGIESIDVSSFYKNNTMNFTKYVNKSEYYMKDPKVEEESTVPGLFSGWIKDYEKDDPAGKGYEENGKGIRGNDRIRSVTMTSVLYLPDYAFDNCERLVTVTLGDGMEKVGALPFRDCPELINLTGNAKYPADNGILYETQTGEQEAYKIVECLQARGSSDPIADRTLSELTDPKITYVESIDECAFENCDWLSLVNLSAATHLTAIQDGTFKDCDSLATITLPASVNDIQDDAFAGVRTGIPSPNTRFTVEIPGTEVSISDNAFGKDSEYSSLLKHAKERAKILTYKDTAAYRYAVYYAKEDMEVDTYPDSENTYSVVFMDYDGTQLGDVQYIVNDKAEVPDTTELEKPDHRPGYKFNGKWLGTNGQDIDKKISANCMFFAQYDSDGTMVNGKYVVEFRDGINGHLLSGRYSNPDDGKYYIDPKTSFMDNGWEAPPRESHDAEGFESLDSMPWSDSWTENTIIESNMTVIALYKAKNTSGGSTNTPGGGSSGSTNTPGAGNLSGTTTNTSSNNSTSSTTSSSSDSTSSTSSGSDSTGVKYTVTVENGSGSGSYEVGSTVVIAANEPAPGMVFQKWTTESNGVTLASVSMTATTFTMPANNVTVTANYVASTATTGNTGNTGNSVNTGNGSTRVDITKPGISNKDLATANVNGSTDNFIVKITETDEATRAVSDALTNKYGSLDNILYYAMDISLYDASGTYKITDTSGLSVDITIPIPDVLVAYGGNNMAGAVINGNQLENLNENFTTINGVPCIRFTATHFSPYTVYVDTGNLTEGMLDTTPKTGDPIHPKWFLSIGLACLSVILFMKKDKAVKVKTA